MTRIRKLAIALTAASTLAVAASALAAKPTHGAFAGKTSLHKINGFFDLVTFVSHGRVLRKFQFGTLGCFGHGAFPVGVDPYGDPTAIGTVARIPVTAKGTFLVTTKPVFPGADGTVTTATIKGVFRTAKSVHGTITIKQTFKGDSCGPRKMKFTATRGTPSSLGLDGP